MESALSHRDNFFSRESQYIETIFNVFGTVSNAFKEHLPYNPGVGCLKYKHKWRY